MWYGEQLKSTYETHGVGYLPFVPDSPTASLFFTIALLLLLMPNPRWRNSFLGGLAVAFGTITSVKYGIWAVTMIFAGAAQGDILVWQDWMLVISHLGMALEAVLFIGLFTLRPLQLGLVVIWMLTNDFLDYHRGVYPWLPKVLRDDLASIEAFTLSLSLFSFIVIIVVHKWSKKGQPPIR
ncbi:MAG: hypothetical protein K0R67_801 [Paenibacillus sp.]|nr:hypothetical protein [Paenibacillus sp.]